jgi:hypothetical protein
MGETVTKVDGEEFFGDDPGMAVKFTCRCHQRVQVFNKKRATKLSSPELTMVKPNNQSASKERKVILVKLMAPVNSTESDPRYNSNVLLSSFKGKENYVTFLLNGNTGQDGLSWQDNDKFGGGDGNVSMSMDDDGNVNYRMDWRQQ